MTLIWGQFHNRQLGHQLLISSKIDYLELLWHIPGANELIVGMMNIHMILHIQFITFTKCKRLNTHTAFTPQHIHHQLNFRTRLFSLVSIMMLGCIDGSGWSSMAVNNATPLCPVLKHDKLRPSITPWKTRCGHIIERSFFSKYSEYIYVRACPLWRVMGCLLQVPKVTNLIQSSII